MSFLYRPHRSLLVEAMAEVREFESFEALVKHEKRSLGRMMDVSNLKIKAAPYCFDDRIAWDTYIISAEGFGVLGFTNGDPTKEPNDKA